MKKMQRVHQSQSASVYPALEINGFSDIDTRV